ncbi:MAG TPA: hypothetical protein VJ809_10300 [Pirellulales bacterium]|nr:hypothetical protein [Pirellulales bacterium]
MRPSHLLIAAALTAAMSGIAAAQTPTAATTAGDTRSSWLATGFVGSNFGTNHERIALDKAGSVDFGGQLAFLWKGTIGGEFIADFVPNVGDNLAFANEPQVNSYMGNVIAAIPLGASGRYQPYMSGGAGVIQLSVDLFDDIANPASSTFSSSNAKPGGNIGGGFMAFADHFGVRADVRYFKAFSDTIPEAPFMGGELINHLVLNGLGFWRSSVGLAIRW